MRSTDYGRAVQGGRFESRVVARNTSAPNVNAPRNANRVAVIFVGVWPDASTSTGTPHIGSGDGAGIVTEPLLSISRESPVAIAHYRDYGDAVYGQISAQDPSGEASLSVWEVVWHPDGE